MFRGSEFRGFRGFGVSGFGGLGVSGFRAGGLIRVFFRANAGAGFRVSGLGFGVRVYWDQWRAAVGDFKREGL